MGGGQRSTTTESYTPEQRALQGMQAGVASSLAPGLQQYLLSVLGGDPSMASGYAASARAPVESATQKAISGILARTPKGGMQNQLIEQTREQGGLQESQVQQDYIKQALAMAASLFNYRPSAQGQTTTQSSGPRIGINAGPLSLAF